MVVVVVVVIVVVVVVAVVRATVELEAFAEGPRGSYVREPSPSGKA